MSDSVLVLKKPGGGENTHSVFEEFFFVPMCISSPNQAKWSERRVIHLSMPVLDSKKINAPLSTYSMQNISKSIPDEKVPGRWLTNCPFDLGELSFHENWALLSPRAVHSSSSISEKAIIKNINSTGAIMSPCLTPTLKAMDVSILPMMSLTTLLLYMRLIAEHSLGTIALYKLAL